MRISLVTVGKQDQINKLEVQILSVIYVCHENNLFYFKPEKEKKVHVLRKFRKTDHGLSWFCWLVCNNQCVDAGEGEPYDAAARLVPEKERACVQQSQQKKGWMGRVLKEVCFAHYLDFLPPGLPSSKSLVSTARV